MSGSRAFPQTTWSLIDAVKADGANAAARDALAERYHLPCHAYAVAFLKRTGWPLSRREDVAADVVQEFFTTQFPRVLQGVDRSKGAFRPYLKRALANFVSSQALRRAESRRAALASELPEQLADKSDDPEEAFDRAWVRDILQRAQERVVALCVAQRQEHYYTLFKAHVTGDGRSWSERGAPYGLTARQAEHCAHTVTRRFGRILREIMVEEEGSESSADGEILALLTQERRGIS